MSFERLLKIDLNAPEFSTARYVKDFKERQNISKSKLDENKDCAYLDVGESRRLDYTGELGPRYITCTGMSYDLVLSVYDVNNKAMVVRRFYEFKDDVAKMLQGEVSKLSERHTNLEARLIGMQDNQYFRAFIGAFLFIDAMKLPLFEVDLFGKSTRNVAFDVKTGLTFDVLMQNRPYKPGETDNTVTVEQFERGIKQQQTRSQQAAAAAAASTEWQKPAVQNRKKP